jgi:hypothetical protein
VTQVIRSSFEEVGMRSQRRNTPANASAPENPRSRTNARRRGFLLALGVGGAGAAALAARSLTGGAPLTDSAAGPDASKGYQVTDHVRRYYGTTKV